MFGKGHSFVRKRKRDRLLPCDLRSIKKLLKNMQILHIGRVTYTRKDGVIWDEFQIIARRKDGKKL